MEPSPLRISRETNGGIKMKIKKTSCSECDFEFNDLHLDDNDEEFIPEHYCLSQGTGDVEDDWVESQEVSK